MLHAQNNQKLETATLHRENDDAVVSPCSTNPVPNQLSRRLSVSTPNGQNNNPSPPAALLLQIISGFWVSRAVYVVAKLGIPDLLKSGPKTAEELADTTQTHASSLYRVLRALASVGVLGCMDNCFAQTPVLELLTTDAPGSLSWF